jgi:hypothetical protein
MYPFFVRVGHPDIIITIIIIIIFVILFRLSPYSY